MLAWLSVWSKVQTCIWPSWCHGHSLSLASVESWAVLPFWYWLTQVVPEKGPLNGCVCVHMWSSCSTDSINIRQQMLEFSSTVIFTLCVPMYQLNLQAPAEIQLIRQTMPYIKQGYHLNNTHTHTHLMVLFPGLPGWASTRNVTPIWIILKQKTVSGNGISWAICKSAPRCRQITMPAPHHSVFTDLPAAQPTASNQRKF